MTEFFELGLFDDLVVMRDCDVVDGRLYEIKRITLYQDCKGYMGHYFLSEKSLGGMSKY